MNYYTEQWQNSILLLIMNAGKIISLHEILLIKTNLVPKSCASWYIRESFSASCTHPEASNCFIPNSRCKWKRIASRCFHLLQGTIHFPDFNSTSRFLTNGKHILKGTRIKKNQSILASHWKSYASDTNVNECEINASNYTSHTLPLIITSLCPRKSKDQFTVNPSTISPEIRREKCQLSNVKHPDWCKISALNSITKHDTLRI